MCIVHKETFILSWESTTRHWCETKLPEKKVSAAFFNLD